MDNGNLRAIYADYIAALNERRLHDMVRFVHDQLLFNGKPSTREEYVATIAGHLDAVPDYRWHVEDLIIEGDRAAVRLLDHGTPVNTWSVFALVSTF